MSFTPAAHLIFKFYLGEKFRAARTYKFVRIFGVEILQVGVLAQIEVDDSLQKSREHSCYSHTIHLLVEGKKQCEQKTNDCRDNTRQESHHILLLYLGINLSFLLQSLVVNAKNILKLCLVIFGIILNNMVGKNENPILVWSARTTRVNSVMFTFLI